MALDLFFLLLSHLNGGTIKCIERREKIRKREVIELISIGNKNYTTKQTGKEDIHKKDTIRALIERIRD